MKLAIYAPPDCCLDTCRRWRAVSTSTPDKTPCTEPANLDLKRTHRPRPAGPGVDRHSRGRPIRGKGAEVTNRAGGKLTRPRGSFGAELVLRGIPLPRPPGHPEPALQAPRPPLTAAADPP